MKMKRYKQQAGFTLIELMIASAVFVVVTVTGVSVLLNATNNYRTTAEIRQSMDTLAFVMEDMTRTIRLGTDFHCINWLNVDTFNPCPVNDSSTVGQMGGSFLALESYNGQQTPDDQVMYWIYSPTGTLNRAYLYKKPQSKLGQPSSLTPDPQLFSQITPDNVYIDMSKSGFSVSQPGSSYATPVVTVRLAGEVLYRNTAIPFSIQSTVAPRNIPSPEQ